MQHVIIFVKNNNKISFFYCLKSKQIIKNKNVKNAELISVLINHKFIYLFIQLNYTNQTLQPKMNFANYSPYNKSYRFICFQNQAYHEKNKKNASPCVKTNIRYVMDQSYSNPESFSEVKKLSYSQRRSLSSRKISRPSSRSQIFSSQKVAQSMIRSSSSSNAIFKQDKRVVHKNQSFEKFRARKINLDNVELVNRLLQSQCQVIQKKQTEKSFNKHLKYREIRKKYNQYGERKSKMCLGNQSLLCPTLNEYNKSGLAEKFVEVDLSMSMTASTPSSPLRRRKSGIQSRQSANQLNQVMAE